MSKPAVLYISYDGMLEPLGQSQVIAYLERLAGEYEFHLVSFEKPADWADGQRRSAIAERLERAGIAWHPLRYHKRPTVPATLFDIAQGIVACLWLVVRHRIRLIHARSYVAALIGRVVKVFTRARLLFDMRGFWADERTDGGLWPQGGAVYRIAKRVEKSLILGADHIVTLTHASRDVLATFPYLADGPHRPIDVITTCADLDRFAPDEASRPNVLTLGYLGSVGTWYMLDEMLACFRILREYRPEARLLIANRNDHALIRARLAEHAIDPADVELVRIDHAEAPSVIRRMSAGMAIIKPAFSKISSAPTKLAEYLGCGVPCLGNAGVGDVQELLEGRRVGIALDDLGPAGLRSGVERLLALMEDPDLPARCRSTALELFSLDGGVAAYRAIYAQLVEARPVPAAAA